MYRIGNPRRCPSRSCRSEQLNPPITDPLYCMHEGLYRPSESGSMGSVWIAFQHGNLSMCITGLPHGEEWALCLSKTSYSLSSPSCSCHHRSSLCIARRPLLTVEIVLHTNRGSMIAQGKEADAIIIIFLCECRVSEHSILDYGDKS